MFYSYGNTKSHQNDSLRHKRELEKKILAASQAHQDSGIEEDRDTTRDDALELMGRQFRIQFLIGY